MVEILLGLDNQKNESRDLVGRPDTWANNCGKRAPNLSEGTVTRCPLSLGKAHTHVRHNEHRNSKRVRVEWQQLGSNAVDETRQTEVRASCTDWV